MQITCTYKYAIIKHTGKTNKNMKNLKQKKKVRN